MLNHFNDPANCTFSTQPFFMAHFKTICAIPSPESTHQHYAYDLNIAGAFISKIIQCFNGANPYLYVYLCGLTMQSVVERYTDLNWTVFIDADNAIC